MKREARAGLPSDQRYRWFPTAYDWFEYVGDLTQPLVALRVVPKLEETTGSLILNAIAAAVGSVRAPSRYRFRGDVSTVEIFRNGQLVVPLRGGIKPIRAHVQAAFLDVRDVAYEGLYLLAPDLFTPDQSGLPPLITLSIGDLKQGGSREIYQLPGATVARIWNDFVPSYKSLSPDSPVTIANSDLPRTDGDGFEFRGWVEETAAAVQSVFAELRMYPEGEPSPRDYGTRMWFVVPYETGHVIRVTLWSSAPGRGVVRVLGGPQELRDQLLEALRSRLNP